VNSTDPILEAVREIVADVAALDRTTGLKLPVEYLTNTNYSRSRQPTCPARKADG